MRHRWALLMTLALAAIAARPAPAQLHVEGAVMHTWYRPLGKFDQFHVQEVGLPADPKDMTGDAWGLQGRVWLRHRIGIQAGGFSVKSSVCPCITPAGIISKQDVDVGSISVAGLYEFSLLPRQYRSWLAAGAARIRHGGQAYARHGNPTTVAPILGACVSAPVAGLLRFEASASFAFYNFDVPYTPDLQMNPGSFEHGFQKDAMLQLGFGLAVP